MADWILSSPWFSKCVAAAARRPKVILPSALCLVLGFFYCGLARSEAPPIDPVEQSLQAYGASVTEVRKNRAALSEQQQREHWQHWLDILTTAIEANPESRFRRAAISKSVGLANSLGQVEISQKLSAMLSESATSLDQRLFWMLQEYLSARQEASKARDNTRVEKILASLLAAIGEARAVIQKGGASEALMVVYVDACMTAENALRNMDGRKAEADQLLDDASRVAKPGIGGPDGMAFVGIIRSQLEIALKDEDVDTADRLFSELASFHGLLEDPPFSELLLRYADKRFPERNQKWINFTESWLSKVSPDRLTPIAQLEVGYELTNERDCVRAIRILEPLRESSVDLLAKHSGGNLRADDGGLLGQLWYSLAIAYAQCGKIDSAKAALRNLKEVAPRHPRIINIESQFVLQGRRADIEQPPIPVAQKHPMLYWVFIAVNVVVIVAICSLFLLRRRGHR